MFRLRTSTACNLSVLRAAREKLHTAETLQGYAVSCKNFRDGEAQHSGYYAFYCARKLRICGTFRNISTGARDWRAVCTLHAAYEMSRTFTAKPDQIKQPTPSTPACSPKRKSNYNFGGQ